MSRNYPNGYVLLERPTNVDYSHLDNYGVFVHENRVLPSRQIAFLSPATPNYKALKRSGGRLPVNNYRREKIVWSNTNGHRFSTRTEVGPPSVTQITGDSYGLMYLTNHPSYSTSDWWNWYFHYKFVSENSDLINSALSNVAHGPDVMTFLAELKDVKHLHRDVVSSFKRMAKRYFSSAWMCYRYGFLPLMYAVKDFAEYAAAFSIETLKKHGDRTSGRSSTLTYTPNFSRDNFSKTVGDPGCKELIHTQSIEATGSMYYRVNGLSQAKSTLNINPWLTAWELIPLSFAIDWLVDIGSALDACTVSASLAEPEVSLCTKWQFSSVGSCHSTKPPDPFYVYRKKDDLSPAVAYLHTSYDVSHHETITFRHEVYQRSVSRPAQVFPELPRLRPNMSAERAIDAMSLYSLFSDRDKNYIPSKRLFR